MQIVAIVPLGNFLSFLELKELGLGNSSLIDLRVEGRSFKI